MSIPTSNLLPTALQGGFSVANILSSLAEGYSSTLSTIQVQSTHFLLNKAW